jgi:hypothetical protein
VASRRASYDGYFDSGRRVLEQAAQGGRRAVADERRLADGEHRGELERAGRRDVVADQKDTAEYRVQDPSAPPTRDRTACDAGHLQLDRGDQRKLPVRHPSNGTVTPAIRVHKVPQRRLRDHRGHISVWDTLMRTRRRRPDE